MANPYLLDVQPYEEYNWYTVAQIIGAINGYVGYGVPWVLSDIDLAGPGVLIRNQNPLGSGLAVYSSNFGTLELVVDDTGVGMTDLFVANIAEVGVALQVDGTLTVVGGTSLGANVFVHNGAVMAWDAGDGAKITFGPSSYGIGLSGTHLTLFSGGGNRGLWFRDASMAGTEWEVWHAGNDGIGSGLDADTVRTLAPGGGPGNLAILDSNSRVLDSEKLEGHSAAYFATIADITAALAGYIAKGGDTTTGAYTFFGGPINISGDLAVSGNGLYVDGTSNKVRINTATVTGWDLTVGSGGIYSQGEATLTGDVNLGTNGSNSHDVNGTVTFHHAVAFQDPLTISDSVSVSGSDISMNLGRVNFEGAASWASGAGFTTSAWDGWFSVKVGGVVKYVPYKSAPPS